MLEGISRRQNISARVATILACSGTPPKTNTNTPKTDTPPVSRIPVKVPSASPQLSSTNQQTSNQEKRVLSSQNGANNAQQNSASEQTIIADVIEPSTDTFDTPKSDKSQHQSEDEDVERMTEEYRAILKGVSNSAELNKEIDDLRAQIEETQTPTPSEVSKQEHVREYMLDAADMLKDESETEDELDRDVKRILSKSGRNVGGTSFSDAGDVSTRDCGGSVMGARESPARSAYDTDDTLANRVQHLLKANKARSAGTCQESVATPQTIDTPRSITQHDDLVSTTKSEDTLPAELGSLKHRLQDALQGGESPANSGQKLTAAYSSDPLNDRVRQILADTTHHEAPPPPAVTTRTVPTARLSDNGSPSSSVDYQNLAKDLDEIQSHLESLKGTGENTSGRQSNISEQSAELLKYVEGRVEDETLRKARAVIGESEPETESTTSSRLEPEGQGRYSPVPRLPLSPLLTSGLVPMDIALNMIHGSAENQSRKNSGYYNRTADTDTLLKEAAEKYSRAFTPNVRPV